MKVAYLIDTDWIIDHFNQVDRTTQKLKELRPAGIAMSVISLAELYEGIYYSRDLVRSQHVLDTFLRDIPVLGVDEGNGGRCGFSGFTPNPPRAHSHSPPRSATLGDGRQRSNPGNGDKHGAEGRGRQSGRLVK